MDTVIPSEREGQTREASLRARVTGSTQDGRAFETETVLRDLSLHGAMVYLDYRPKLQSELRILIESSANAGPNGDGQGNSDVALRGYVVRIEPGPEKNQVGVGIVFTE